MNISTRSNIARAIFLMAFGLGAATCHAANRVALVIGNGAYQKVPLLPNPTRDAAAIGDSLVRLGFTVTRLNNVTASEMRKSVVEFGRAASGSEMAVVFYAGHGMEVAGDNWLIPVDAELRSDVDAENEAISLKGIELQVAKASQLGLVILDACRNNPFNAKMQRSLTTRSVSRGLAPIEPTDNVLIAYAAKGGTVANDGSGSHSPFTKALLRHLEVPGLEITFMFRAVRDEVMAETKREQQPFVYGSLSKEAIYLKQSVPAQEPTAPLAAVPSRVVDPTPAADASLSPAKSPAERNTVTGGVKQNVFSPEDMRRITAIAIDQKLKMPPFAIGETKSDVKDDLQRFVGVWSNKIPYGGEQGRFKMLIVTEVTADAIALGYYVWGPSNKNSWLKDAPSGFSSFAANISDGRLSYKSGDWPIEAKPAGSSITLSLVNLHPQPGQAKTGKNELRPLWRLVSTSQMSAKGVQLKRPDAPRTSSGKTGRVEAQIVSRMEISRPNGVVGLSMEDRYRACRRLVKGFAQRDACARNGGI